MQKQKNLQLAVIGVLSFAVLFMSVGFAAYSQTLNITGAANVSANKWSIHFVPSSYQLADGSKSQKSIDFGDTAITYSVDLAKPGDYYAFNINVINDGTFNAVLQKITMSSLTAAQQKYLTYTVTYNGRTYTSTTDNIMDALPIATGSNTKTATVKVAYVQPDNASDLPQQAVSVNLSVAFDYVQSE